MKKSEKIQNAIQAILGSKPDVSVVMRDFYAAGNPAGTFDGSVENMIFQDKLSKWYLSFDKVEHLRVALSVAIADEYLDEAGLL